MKLAYRLLNGLIAFLLMTALILTPQPVAAGDSIPELFGLSPAADAAPAALSNSLARRSRTTTLNPALLDNVQSALARSRDSGLLGLSLFSDTRLVARFKRAEHSLDGGLTLIGNLDNSPLSENHLSRVGNSFFASLNTGSSLYEFKSLDGQSVQITQVDTSRLPPEEDLIPALNPAGVDAPVAVTDVQSGPNGIDDGSRIDVYVGYTSAARTAAGGSAQMQARIATAIAETNTGYANSGVTQRVTLVGSGEYAYNESAGISGWEKMLGDWSNPANGILGPAHTARDVLKADEMVLIVNDGTYCGLGYLMDSKSISPAFASSAFALVALSCATGYYSFAHEMGHNMGAHHDPTTAGSAQGAYPYSYGYWISNPATGRKDYRTIMAYDTTSSYSYSSQRVNYWSNPDVILPATGSPTGTQTSNNARTLNNTTSSVAQFRDGLNPLPPDSLTVSAQKAVIQLNWTFSSTDVWKFRIERADYGFTNWTELGQTGPSVLTYTDPTVAANKNYSYRILSDNGNGRTASAAANISDAPADLVVSAPAFGQLKFIWTDTSTNETGFSIERAETSLNNWVAIGQTPANVTTFTDPAAIGNKDYAYRVLAVNGTVKAASTAVNFLGAPSTLHTSFTSGKVQLDWTNNSALATGYQVERNSGNTESWAVVSGDIVLPAGAQTYQDTPLLAGEYRYRVRALGPAGSLSFYSNLGYTLPNPPTSVSATPVNQARIALTWTDNSLIESGFQIATSADGLSDWRWIADVPAVSTNPASYLVTDLVCNTPYHFQVRAQNNAGSSPAIPVNATTPACAAPDSPGLAPLVSSFFSITLNWTNVESETGYRIEKQENSNWVEVFSTLRNVTTYTVTGLRPGTLYHFRVIAENNLAPFDHRDSDPVLLDGFTHFMFYLPIITK